MTDPDPDPDPRDLFDSTILPDLPDTPPSLVQALRDMYVAGYHRALQEMQQIFLQEATEQIRAAAAPPTPPDASTTTTPERTPPRA